MQPDKRAVSTPDLASKRRKLNDGVASQSQSPAPKSRLTDEERGELRKWLDKTDEQGGPIFNTKIPLRKGGKNKKGAPSVIVQQLKLNGKDHLQTHYTVTPADKWAQLTKYKKFTVNEVTHETGGCVFVKHSEDKLHDPNLDWKAQVLEVRALDEHHVYLRVCWLQNPEDLPDGRASYHGRLELVPSNSCDIVDAMTVNGGLEVMFWDEADDDTELPGDRYFWRQTFNEDTGTLSNLRSICQCETPQNPDKLIICCSNPKCGIWLHASCLAEDALRRVNEKTESEATDMTPSSKKDKSKPRNKTQHIRQSLKTEKDKLVEIVKDEEADATDDAPGSGQQDVKGTIVENDALHAEVVAPQGKPPKAIITNKGGGEVVEESVYCLLCNEIMV